MANDIQEAYTKWRTCEERANRLAYGATPSQAEAAKARQGAMAAWRVYWEHRWEAEQDAAILLKKRAENPFQKSS